MKKLKTVKSLKVENKHLKALNEYLVHKWGVEVLEIHNYKLKNKLMTKIISGMAVVITIALILSPIIPITSFCSTTGLCPYYNIWHQILTKIDSILSERTNFNNVFEVDNLLLVIIGFWMFVFIVIKRISIYKRDKEIKEL